jgi:hypothetical protein
MLVVLRLVLIPVGIAGIVRQGSQGLSVYSDANTGSQSTPSSTKPVVHSRLDSEPI